MIQILITFAIIITFGAFCHMNEATQIQKYMMLNSKPTTSILVNNMIEKYSKRTGVSSGLIKGCIENKKKQINLKKGYK